MDGDQQTDPGLQVVNMVSPTGDIEGIYQKDLGAAQQVGYSPATQDDINQYSQSQKYSGVGQGVKAYLEGIGRGSSFGTSTGAEQDLGIATSEDISGRQQQWPFVAPAGEITGLIGSSLAGYGEGAILDQLGAKVLPKALASRIATREAAVKAAEQMGETGIAQSVPQLALSDRVGSAVVKGFAQTTAYQGGNEIHQMFLGDSPGSVGTIAADMGLAGLSGGILGGIGAGIVNPLWQSTAGKKLGGFLDAFKRRANGEAISLAPELEGAVGTSAMDIAPEIRAALTNDPEIANQWQKLQESTTSPGISAQKALKDFKSAASNNLVSSLGKSVDDIPNLGDISNYEIGSKLQQDLGSQIKEQFQPVSDAFNNIRDQFSKIPLTAEQDVLADKLAELQENQRWNVPSLPQNKLIQDTMSDLPHLKDLEDLRRYQSNIWSKVNPQDGNMWYATGKIVGVLRDMENSVLERAAGEKSPQILDSLQSARDSYKSQAEMLEDLNGRLRAGKYTGPESFVRNLQEMKPEDVLTRLSRVNDAGLLDLLNNKFPQIAQDVKDASLNKILAQAALKAPEGQSINPKTLFASLDKLSPEMKGYLLPAGAEAKINATRAILDRLPERLNPSGTAKTLDSLWNKVPGSATGIIGTIMGHNPISSFLTGQAGKWIGRDIPDAIRLGFLKFLGQSGPVKPSAFKTIVDLAHSATKGETIMNKAVKNLVRGAGLEFINNKLPSIKQKVGLDSAIKNFSENPNSLLSQSDNISYYMPEHAQEISSTLSRASNYLNSLRPNESPPGPLDDPRRPPVSEYVRYDNALNIAQNPLSVLTNIQEGFITPEDIVDMKTLYPGLYERASQKMFSEIMEAKNKDIDIPYKTRIGLSMFLGQGLDSTLQPRAIAMNQPIPTPQAPQIGKPGTKKLQSLKTLASMNSTPNQAQAMDKLTKG